MSVKIALEVLGTTACVGTATTGIVFAAPKLKTWVNTNLTETEDKDSAPPQQYL